MIKSLLLLISGQNATEKSGHVLLSRFLRHSLLPGWEKQPAIWFFFSQIFWSRLNLHSFFSLFSRHRDVKGWRLQPLSPDFLTSLVRFCIFLSSFLNLLFDLSGFFVEFIYLFLRGCAGGDLFKNFAHQPAMFVMPPDSPSIHLCPPFDIKNTTLSSGWLCFFIPGLCLYLIRKIATRLGSNSNKPSNNDFRIAFNILNIYN